MTCRHHAFEALDTSGTMSSTRSSTRRSSRNKGSLAGCIASVGSSDMHMSKSIESPHTREGSSIMMHSRNELIKWTQQILFRIQFNTIKCAEFSSRRELISDEQQRRSQIITLALESYDFTNGLLALICCFLNASDKIKSKPNKTNKVLPIKFLKMNVGYK